MKITFVLFSAILLFALFPSSKLYSQEIHRMQEFQVSFDIMEGIKNHNIYYKVGFKNKENKYWRARIGRTSNYVSDLYLTQNGVSVGLGYETRLSLIRKSQLVIGFEPFGSLVTSKLNSLKRIKPGSYLWGAGFGVPLGVIINDSSKWYIAIETIPSLYFQQVSKDEYGVYKDETESVNFGFHSFDICFGYRFPTKRT